MRKIHRPAAFLLTAVLILSGLVMPVFAANDKVVEAREGVVRVICITAEYYSIGTAFVISQSNGRTTLITNYHVVADNPNNVYVVPESLDDAYYECKVQPLPDTYSDGLDLAFLTVDLGLGNYRALPLADTDTVQVTDLVYALGFPGIADDGIDEGDSLPSSIDNITVTEGNVSKTNSVQNGVTTFQHSAPISAGNSGGPLVNEDGAVIGVNTTGFEGVEYSYSIYVDYIIEACNEFGIEYTPYTVATVGPGTDDPADPATSPTPVPEPKPDFNLADYWWVLLLIVIGGVGAFFIMKNRGQGTPAAAPEMAQPSFQGTLSSSVRLMCISGPFAGTTFPVNGSISIGRDPRRCQIVFPGDTQGVSSLHCEVTTGPSGVWLTDKGSTYGTYLSGGRKLNSGESVQVQRGSSFYLAGTKNEFKFI
jgi:hypothetical protein